LINFVYVQKLIKNLVCTVYVYKQIYRKKLLKSGIRNAGKYHNLFKLFMLRLFLILITLTACESRPDPRSSNLYKLDSPDKRYILPSGLKEISGINFSRDGKYILCIEDNAGDIFWFDPAGEKVVRTEKFTGAGDFEDLAVTDSAIYVVRSDGTLFEVSESTTREHKTFLTSDNNIESLCYDKPGNRLLLMLKDKSVSGRDSEKECFQFNLATKTCIESPVFRLTYHQLSPYAHKKSKRVRFKPSGFAIHPQTGELYVISGTAHAIIHTDLSGHIRNFNWLDNKLFPQPEGICFDTEGNLYISNEGRKGDPDILMFKQLKK
jgi:hypothetical protein